MKRLFSLLLLLTLTAAVAQVAENQKRHYLKITSKTCVKKKGYRLQIKEIVSDSRCPEGVNCVWAGEIKVLVSVYHDKKWMSDDTLAISSRHYQENRAWFGRYLPAKKQNIQSIGVLPYPKKGTSKNYAGYYIEIGYL